eukprot:4387675-Prymnesium_polylepis.1
MLPSRTLQSHQPGGFVPWEEGHPRPGAQSLGSGSRSSRGLKPPDCRVTVPDGGRRHTQVSAHVPY